MDFTNVTNITNGVITEYSPPSVEDELDSIRKMIVEQYKTTGNVDLTRIPLNLLLELWNCPNFESLQNKNFRANFESFLRNFTN